MKRVIGSILILAGIVGALLSMAGCIGTPFEVAGDIVEASFDAAGAVASVPFQIIDGGVSLPSHFDSRLEQEEVRTVAECADLGTLDAQAQNGVIEVRCIENASTTYLRYKVVVHGNSMKAVNDFLPQVRVLTERQGNTLKIYKQHPRPPRNLYVSVNYYIDVPASASLRLGTSNGTVRVDNARRPVYAHTSNAWMGLYNSDCNAELATSNGKITVEHVRGSLKASSSNAEIEAVDLQGDSVLETSNGRILLSQIVGPVYASTTNGEIQGSVANLRGRGEFRTSNGSVNLTLYSGSAPLTIANSNGSIDLTLPLGMNGSLTASTSNASVESDYPLMVRLSSKDRLEGQLGDGNGPPISLYTSNGSIHLRRGNGYDANRSGL